MKPRSDMTLPYEYAICVTSAAGRNSRVINCGYHWAASNPTDETVMNRPMLYVLANVAVAILALVGFGLHKGVANPIYVMLLFAICSTPIFEARAVNGPYSLLVLWLFDYFVMYGALDLHNLLFGVDHVFIEADGLLSTSELVILTGGVVGQIAYRLACGRASGSTPAIPLKDWSEFALLAVGIAMWIVGSRLTWIFSVDTFTAKTAAATKAGFERLGDVKLALIMAARMAQPVSILILAYVQCRYKRAYMTPILLAVVFYQLVFGFIIDTKSEGLIGGVLVILTNLMVNGRVPKTWLVLMLIIIALGFPILQANRVARDEFDVDPRKAAENLALSFNRALEATGRTTKGPERTQTALERATTKSSVEIIVKGTGTVTPFEHGYTLLPMLTTFIPRLIWADKPSIPTGQIMNKDFHVSEGEDTYISPSHLGELYWNFGWPGVVVGMSIIGALFGYVGARFDLSKGVTITRMLVIVVTIREVILNAEGEIATHYVVWMRSILGIALLHWAFARKVLDARSPKESAVPVAASDPPKVLEEQRARMPRPFPNLLT
jgi:hypothetical protein